MMAHMPRMHAAPEDHLLHWPHSQPPLDLLLTPERAVVWPAQRTLFIADVHLGKAAVFRARGIPVPQGTTSAMLTRLTQVIERTQTQRLVVLGDFLHARESQASATLQALQAWRNRHANLECTVVQGNHDRHAGAVQASLGFVTQTTPFRAAGLIGVHEAHEAQGWQEEAPSPSQAGHHIALVLTGHEHPVVNLRDRLDRLRLPCYRLRHHVLTLPAFGDFTGGHDAHAPGDRLFAIADRVYAL